MIYLYNNILIFLFCSIILQYRSAVYFFFFYSAVSYCSIFCSMIYCSIQEERFYPFQGRIFMIIGYIFFAYKLSKRYPKKTFHIFLKGSSGWAVCIYICLLWFPAVCNVHFGSFAVHCIESFCILIIQDNYFVCP